MSEDFNEIHKRRLQAMTESFGQRGQQGNNIGVAYNQKQASPPPPIRKTDDEIRINILVEENQKMKEKYGDLVKKANMLIEAYREMKTKNEVLIAENEVLKKKKAKQDSVKKVFSDVGKNTRDVWGKIILWFNT